MAPLYAARIEGLGPGDFVKVEGGACGHNRALTNQMLATTGAKPIDQVLDLEPRLRCRECDAKGKAIVPIRWAAD